MNYQSYIMIQCILPDIDDDVEQLSKTIAAYLKEHWPTVRINLKTNNKYWKYEDSRQVIYNILCNVPLQVCDVIKIFKISWVYSESVVFDIHVQKSVYEQEAIWSKVSHPSESFLNTNVEWVHIYTWLA